MTRSRAGQRATLRPEQAVRNTNAEGVESSTPEPSPERANPEKVESISGMKFPSALYASVTTVAVIALGGWVWCRNGVSHPTRVTERSIATSRQPGAAREFARNHTIAPANPSSLEPPMAVPAPRMQSLASALATLQGKENDENYGTLLETMASQVAVSDLAAEVDFLNRQSLSPAVIGLRSHLLRRWASIHPRAAANAAVDIGDAHRQEAINTVMGVWVEQSSKDAIAWAEHLPSDGAISEGTLLAMGFDVARSSPKQAIELVSKLPVSRASDELLAHAAAQWAATEPEEAGNWARTISDEVLRTRLIGVIAMALGDGNPVAAAHLALEEMPAGKEQNDAIVSIVQRWAQTNPQAAADWVAVFPAGEVRDAAMENMVKLWAEQDLNSPGIWINGLDRGSGRDSAARAYAEYLAPLSYPAAIAWAETIADPDLRLVQTESIMKLWMTVDRGVAAAWLGHSSLPTAVKQHLFSPQ